MLWSSSGRTAATWTVTFAVFHSSFKRWNDSCCSSVMSHLRKLTVRFCFPEFFVKHGVAVMTVRELFDFITDLSITCHNIDQYLEKVWTRPAQKLLYPQNHCQTEGIWLSVYWCVCVSSRRWWLRLNGRRNSDQIRIEWTRRSHVVL